MVIKIEEIKVVDEVANKILATRGKELELTEKDLPMIKKLVGATLDTIMDY